MIPGLVVNEDGSALIPLGTDLRLGDELDKLASNIALFRSGAGIHYRFDANGIELGEQVAVDLLRNCAKRYFQPMQFKFHLRNGELIEISN